MDWDNVRSFLAVARQGQFLGASRMLKVNQATVARRITALETDLQTTLFERATTGVSLTEAGQHLLVHAERMESEMVQAETDLRQQDIRLSGTVRIGAPDGFTTFFLIPALASFVERHPEIDVQIVPMPVAVSLARREVDIAITLDEPEAGRVVSRRLTDYRLGIYGSRDYLARTAFPGTWLISPHIASSAMSRAMPFPQHSAMCVIFLTGILRGLNVPVPWVSWKRCEQDWGWAFSIISSRNRLMIAFPSCQNGRQPAAIGW